MTIYTDEQDKLSFDWQTTRRLGGYLAPYKRHVYIALVAAIISAATAVTGPLIIGWAIDEGIKNHSLTLVGAGMLVYLINQGIGAFGMKVQIGHMAIAGQRAIQALRNEMFEHIQRMSIAFFSKYETGRLIARTINDVNTLREAITWALVGTFRDLLSLVGIVIAMIFINLPLTIVSLGVLVVLALVANVWRIYARKTYLRVTETNAKSNAELAEAFNGVRVTQAFDRQLFNYNRFAQQFNLDNRDANMRATLVSSLFFPTIELIGGAATGLLIYIGGTLALNQQLNLFTLITFVLYVDQFFMPIRMLAQRYNLFQAVMAAGDKIFHLLDREIEVKDAPDAINLPQIEGRVRFQNVNFTYGGENVLKNVTLDIAAGTTVALVGHTGAGKSTMVKLVMRFYDVTGGSVNIDGYDVRVVSQQSLRGQMGVVPQETYLFSGTVMDNIRYGRLEASDEEVIDAAKAVGAHDFIMKLENAYHTEVREGGTMLSAGQKQLLAFARALLADPRILILDEATSNIDTQTEKVIQSALSRLLKGRTSFVIAHRLSTIVNSDLIVVMDHGEIIEKGTHQDLLALGGAYASMYTMAF